MSGRAGSAAAGCMLVWRSCVSEASRAVLAFQCEEQRLFCMWKSEKRGDGCCFSESIQGLLIDSIPGAVSVVWKVNNDEYHQNMGHLSYQKFSFSVFL